MSLPVALPVWLLYLVSLWLAERGREAHASFRPYWNAPQRTYGAYGRYYMGGEGRAEPHPPAGQDIGPVPVAVPVPGVTGPSCDIGR